jgi:NOL1/NOP2/sun family putative RNA methylase
MTTKAEQLIDYYRAIIPDPEAMLSYLQKPLPTALSVNSLKTTPSSCRAILHNLGIETEVMPWNPNGLKATTKIEGIGRNWAYTAGLYQTQEEVSLLPAIVLDPQPGETVLDMCAAPGGKTAQMAVMMQNTGTLIANDRNYGRLRAVGNMIKRLGLFNIATTALDGTAYPALREHFDKILVDAPCGCEGTWRKSEKKAVMPNRKTSLAMGTVQFKLLEKALQLAKVGGRIVYSTCTFAPEENEAIVSQLLEKHGDAVKILPIQLPNWQASPGITQWQDDSYHPDVQHSLRVWPHQNNSGGFFVALLEKTASKTRHPKPVEQRTETACTDASIAPILQTVLNRFQIDPSLFADYHARADNHRGLYLLPTCLQIPQKLPIDAAGLFSIKTKIKHPKLSTPAAMWMLPYARQNHIELTKQQRDLYLTREDIRLTDEQVSAITSTGYVLVSYQSVGLGVGVYLEYAEGPATLQSLFPKFI